MTKRACLFLFLFSAFTPPSHGQSNYAVLTGSVSDSQHLPVVGASVELTASSTGSVSEGVKVIGGSEVLKTSDASVGEVVEPTSIRELPLNGRMLIDLVLTVPGAHVGFGAQTGSTNPLYWRPGQRSAVVIGGARPKAKPFLLGRRNKKDTAPITPK